jgi:transcriptional regulator with XRE-family HTH domain
MADFVTFSADTGSSSGRALPRCRMRDFSVIAISGTLFMAGTSSAEPNTQWGEPHAYLHEATASGAPLRQKPEAGGTIHGGDSRQAIAELRRLSGLTWDQLAALFNVSRRSVHFWASGKPMSAAHERRLLRVLDVLRTADRGDARSNRSALLTVQHGTSALELLIQGQFDEARVRLGGSLVRSRPVPGRLAPEAQAERAPLPLEELVDAMQDRVRLEPRAARVARTVRNIQRGIT